MKKRTIKRTSIEMYWFYNLFCKFLIMEGVTPRQFFCNCIKQNNGGHLLSFLLHHNIDVYHNIIDYSFTWAKTQEGGDFWHKLDSDFTYFYRQAYKDFESKMSYLKL